MEICATMILQSCQLIGVAEGLTISYPNFLKLYISRALSFWAHSALIWQKEASDKSDISRKWAKCVCQLHWRQWNIRMSYLTYLIVGWVFLHEIWPRRRAHYVNYENINNSNLDGMSLASFCQSRAALARIFAKLALMRKKIAKFQHGATIAPWFQQVDRAHTPLTLLYSTSNHSDLAVRFVHVESRDQFRHMHSARFLRMPDLGEKRWTCGWKWVFYSKSGKKWQPNLVSV